ncbi:hypothetical protein F8388_011064 [Cannabis sativa]|uniref:Uncharacterized protein n=1 Tax=Cannabis sativa TaxID=3483 RepID=A0A7J6F331_CANSA|nr:hypothetical protein F8388_011064 [Cannabis sativa]
MWHKKIPFSLSILSYQGFLAVAIASTISKIIIIVIKQSRRRSFNTYKKFKKETIYEARIVVVEDKDNELHYYGRGVRVRGSNPLEGKERRRIVAPILGYTELNKRQLTNDLIELEMKNHDAALDMDWLSIHLLLKVFGRFWEQRPKTRLLSKKLS